MDKMLRSLSLVLSLGLAACSGSSRSSARGAEARLIGIAAQTSGVVTMLSPDGSHADAGDVVAVVDPFRAELRLDRARGELKEAQHAGNDAAIRLSQDAIDAALRDLNHTRIRTPIAGIVASRSLRVGQPVNAGSVVVAIVPESERHAP